MAGAQSQTVVCLKYNKCKIKIKTKIKTKKIKTKIKTIIKIKTPIGRIENGLPPQGQEIRKIKTKIKTKIGLRQR